MNIVNNKRRKESVDKIERTFIELLQDMEEDARKAFYDDLSAECKRMGKRFTYSSEQIDQPATMQRAREAAIRIAYASRARFVILPLQDALGTGAESRMNCPGILSDRNWSWRVEENALTERLAKKLADMVAKANR